MNVVIFEACRSPRFPKLTEGILLSRLFKKQDIEYKLLSNDFIWPIEARVTLDKDLIGRSLVEFEADIVHFAVHGNKEGLVLQWSDRSKKPVKILAENDIRAMTELRGRLVVSGACSSAPLASAFLSVSAKAVMAPTIDVPWALGHFFVQFYKTLFSGEEPDSALSLAISEFPEFKSFRIYRSDDPMSS